MTAIPNSPPWLHQLKVKRKKNHLTTDTEADIVIVGGGITGISTAYYLLKATKRK